MVVIAIVAIVLADLLVQNAAGPLLLQPHKTITSCKICEKQKNCSLVPRPATFSVARRKVFRVTENGAGLGTRLEEL